MMTVLMDRCIVHGITCISKQMYDGIESKLLFIATKVLCGHADISDQIRP